jgi:hypothetical protein
VWRWPPPPWGRIPRRGWGRARRHPPPFRVAVPAYTTCNLLLTRCGFLNSRCSTALLSPSSCDVCVLWTRQRGGEVALVGTRGDGAVVGRWDGGNGLGWRRQGGQQ